MNYDEGLKERLNIIKIFERETINYEESIYALQKVKTRKIAKNIKNLPKEIQKKIYIYSIKRYYRNHLLRTPRFTLYNEYINHMNRMKKKVIIDNVHFLHLDCNTLPENKKYIVGCQCDYCVNYQSDLKEVVYKSVNGRLSRFINRLGGQGIDSFCNGVVSPNEFYEYDYHTYLSGYNFKKKALKKNPLYSL